jgi:aldehyde:ferredoxin oxidoreductase
MNKIAYVSLTSKTVKTQAILVDLRKLFLGGRGINTHLLYEMVGKETDPRGSENVLIVGAGMLTGVAGISNSRISFSAKSPETGLLGDSAMGGFFGAELRYAGFDHLVLEGNAEKPLYLWIHDGEIEFRDASDLSKLDTFQIQTKLRHDLGDPKIQVACIGPAGRDGVTFACIIHGLSHAAGRTGMGAVMGSKNLWAIAARGKGTIPVHDPAQLLRVVEKHYQQVTRTKGFLASSIYGTMIRLNNTRTQGYEGGLNHQFNMMEFGGEELDAEVFLENYETRKATCFGCPTACKHMFKVPGGIYEGTECEGPEYYGCGGWGSQCGCSSWETILEAWNLCAKYGLDVGSMTAYTAWLMELYEKGIITEEETEGLSLEWGSSETIIGLIQQVVEKRGIGDLLALGWIEAAKAIGRNSESYMDHVKGLSIECDDVRGHRAQTLGLATASRGACHLRSRYTLEEFSLPEAATEKLTGRPVPQDPTVYEGKEWACYWTECICSLADALGVCKFVTKWLSTGLLGFEEFIESIQAVTGIKLSVEELLEIGERIYTTERLFLTREGITRKDDVVPEKFFRPWTHGPRAGTKVEAEPFEKLLDRYYDLHGWDRKGIPTSETLEKLRIGG